MDAPTDAVGSGSDRHFANPPVTQSNIGRELLPSSRCVFGGQRRWACQVRAQVHCQVIDHDEVPEYGSVTLQILLYPES
jgi:hypothetical protein